MKVKETPNSTQLSYCQFVGELLERANLFAPIEFKVIAVLVKRLDYSLENFNVAISLAELQVTSGLGKGSVLRVLGNLQSLGLLEKISGKYDQEIAREIRRDIFKRKQRKTRSFNEVNIYNLSGLYSFLVEVIEFDQECARKYMDEYGIRMKPIDYPSRLLTKLRQQAYKQGKSDFTYFDLLDLLRRHIDQSDWSILTNQIDHIDQSDRPSFDQKPRTKKEESTRAHTHNLEHNDNQGGEEKGKVAQRPMEKGQGTQELERPVKEKKSAVKPFDKIKNKEFRQFILDFLSGSPNIQNPIAVAKALTDADIADYYEMYKQYKQHQQQQQAQAQQKPQESQESQPQSQKELLRELLEHAKTFFPDPDNSYLYKRFFRDGIREIVEENGRIVVVYEDGYTAMYAEKEYGEKIREFFGREVEFRG